MKKEIIIRSRPHAIDFALLHDGKLIELNKEEVGEKKFAVGDIFLAQIKKVAPALNAAFIKVGYEKDGFLHYTDLGPRVRSLFQFVKQVRSKKDDNFLLENIRREKDILKDGKIAEVVEQGQSILVQVVKEPISSKGPRLTSRISLAGRFIVLTPFGSRISISQRITEKDEAKRLREIIKEIKPKNFGIIIRTVALNQEVDALKLDMENLLARWKRLCGELKIAQSLPKKILSELNRSFTLIRDTFDDNFSNIFVDNVATRDHLREYMTSFSPKHQSLIKLFKSTVPIFEKFGIEQQIKLSFGKTVSMKKGAYLVIEHTEALHVIDVNSGNQSNREGSQEEMALEVNLIAASETARQIRLRDMGGIIVVDFIDLQERDNRKKLFEFLKEEMSHDRTKHRILPPSRFGLVQITRQRVRQEMNIKIKEPNPNPSGEINPPVEIINKIYTQLLKIIENKKYARRKIYLHIHPFVAAYLKQTFFSIRLKWYLKHKRWVRIVPRNAYQFMKFRFFNHKNQPFS